MSEYSKETVLKTVAELFDMVKEQQAKIDAHLENNRQMLDRIAGMQKRIEHLESLLWGESK